MLLPGQGLRCGLPLLFAAFIHSNLRRQVPPRLHDARDPSSEGWKDGREYCAVNLDEMTTSMPFWDLLLAANYDMGPTALLPLRRKACWGFFLPKNPTASAGFEPANSGTRGQHAYPYNKNTLLLPMGHQALGSQGFFVIEASRPHSHSSHSVGFLWTSDQPDTLENTQKSQETDIRSCGGFRTPQSQQASCRIPTS